jgi:23S rRNA G2445 N2-methylase RlmL
VRSRTPGGPQRQVDFVARCLRGIEWICAAEIGAVLDAEVWRVDHRVVYFRAPLSPALLSVGTVDDVFLLTAELGEVDHRRAALETLRSHMARTGAADLVAAAGTLRPVPAAAGFEVVGSFLGRRNYNRFEIEEAVGEGLQRATGRRFLPGPHTAQSHPPLSWRVHLYDGGGFLGLRLSDGPLHRRSYRLRSQEGALHPPLAYAAALLGAPAPGGLVLDPFCGAGTMLIEAARLQAASVLLGADISLDAVRAARDNAASAGFGGLWIAGDAGLLALRTDCADLVTTNPPWSRRVEPAGVLLRNPAQSWSELARVMAPDGRAVVVLEDLETQVGALRSAGLEPAIVQRVAVSGAWTTLGLVVPDGRLELELRRLAACGADVPQEAPSA